MKKVLIALVVLLFAVSVYAENRLELSGQMRVEGFAFDNLQNFDDDDDRDQENWFEQRLRIAGKFNVADGISVNFRLDFDEEKWGTEDSHGTSEIQTDRAYLQIDKNMYRLRAGRQLFKVGNAITLDHRGVGFLATLKTPVSITAGYVKVDEGSDEVNNLTDDSDYGSEDINVYFLNLGYKYNKTFNVNAFIGYEDAGDYQADEGTYDPVEDEYDGNIYGEYDKMLVGLQAEGTIADIFNYNLEYNNISGEIDEEDKDYVGNQFYADLSVNINMFKVGTEVFYAMGTDETDEEQTTMLSEAYGDDDSFGPMGGFGGDDIMEYTFGGQKDARHGFFELEQNAGSMGIVPYVSCSPIDKLSLKINVGYFEPEEDSVTNIESVMVGVLSVDYKLYKNVGIKGQYAYVAPDIDEGNFEDSKFNNDDAANAFYGKLYVNF